MSWSESMRGTFEEVKEWAYNLKDPSNTFYGEGEEQKLWKERHEDCFNRAKMILLEEIAVEEDYEDCTGVISVTFAGHAGVGSHQFSVGVNRVTPDTTGTGLVDELPATSSEEEIVTTEGSDDEIEEEVDDEVTGQKVKIRVKKKA